MRLIKDDIKKLIEHRKGVCLLSVEELIRLELDEEYDKLDALYEKSELISYINGSSISGDWLNNNIGELDVIIDEIEKSKKRIYHITPNRRNNKIDNITNEDS